MTRLMRTVREQLEQDYIDADRDFIASTRTMESTGHIVLTAVDQGVTTAGVLTGALVARAGQEIVFFGYDRNSQIPGAGVQAQADDTNLNQARKTNSNEDLSVEGISLALRSMQYEYAQADAPTFADVDALGAFRGGANGSNAVAFDPQAINAPSICQGYVNNEDALMAGIQPHLFLRFRWDKRDEEVGCGDLIPGASAKSLMRSNGMPDPSVRYRIPEGFNWRQSGPDSNLVLVARLVRSVVFPYAAVQPQGQAAKKYLASVRMHVKARVHAIAFGYPPKN